MVWTIEEMPDLTEKVYFITGCTSGIGYHTAKMICEKNGTVIMACRNGEKMSATAATFGGGKVVQLICDTSDLESVRSCVINFKNTGIDRIDVLLLNAGVMNMPYRTTKQGYESHFATNHLGHWLLTGLLLEIITNTPGSRIISVSSVGHRFANKIDYNICKGKNESNYNSTTAYTQSKLANLWFTKELNRRLQTAGKDTVACAAHPGSSKTSLAQRDYTPFWVTWIGKMLEFLGFFQSSEAGAWPLLMASVDSNITRESYYAPSGILELTGPPKSDGYMTATVGKQDAAQELWAVSEEMTDFKYQL